MSRKGRDAPDDAPTPIHGDVLESIFTNLPLIDLLSATRVSRVWKRAVASSLSHRKSTTHQPWLISHAQHPRSPALSTVAHAYDPRSRSWLRLKPPLPPPRPAEAERRLSAPLRSSQPGLLYALSGSTLSFSLDPLHQTWHHAPAPRVWRTDPIVVALVGPTASSSLVVAGGAGEFEDEPAAVEVYDEAAGAWRTCAYLPEAFRSTACAARLSAAADGATLYLTERASGLTHALDTETGLWAGPYKLRPDEAAVLSTAVGFVSCGGGGRMIAVAVMGKRRGGAGDAWDEMGGVKVYEVDRERMEVVGEIGEMPAALVEEMGGGGEWTTAAAIGTCMAEDYVYMYNPWKPEVVAFCEIDDGGRVRRWESVRNSTLKSGMERVVYSCSKVGMGDLEMALKQGLLF